MRLYLGVNRPLLFTPLSSVDLFSRSRIESVDNLYRIQCRTVHSRRAERTKEDIIFSKCIADMRTQVPYVNDPIKTPGTETFTQRM